MRLSPIDIRQQQFTTKLLRGFDRQEVDTFLDDVADDYEGVLRDNATLREQLASYEERVRGLGETEKTLKDTLVTTQRVAEEIKEGAKRDAQLIVREAALSADKLLEESRAEEAKLRVEIQTLKRVRRQLIEELRATVERYDRTLAADLNDASDSSH
ncbi:MAG TPA: DivIVA domain-containing protein [Candidatus Acidoferrum sp.]|nr:DivIVA domain-containing protein [Candidatus Acidoferrum sp.]